MLNVKFLSLDDYNYIYIYKLINKKESDRRLI